MMKRCKTTSCSNQGENFKLIPFDLIIEILLKLPAKSIARFRCVSKLWGSTLQKQDFKESFFTKSSSRPKLLLTCLKDGKTFFFTSHQPQDESPLTVSSLMSFPINYPTQIYRSVRGLVCGLDQQSVRGRKVSVPLVCNPSTGQYLTLPRVSTKRKEVISYLGYVPIDKQYKVLCMSYSLMYSEFQVMTLGTEKEQPWRSIRCHINHERLDYGERRVTEYDGICINGVLYYLAFLWGINGGYFDVVCFDFRSEKFKCIRHDQGMRKHMSIEESTLVNYKGKLAMLQPSIVDGKYLTELWVLEDSEKHKWSCYKYALASPQTKIVAESRLRLVGMTDTGEIVFSPSIISDNFYLLYHNIVTNTAWRVEIQGMEAFKGHKAYIFLDHVEDLNLIASV